MILSCKCGNKSESEKTGTSSLYYSDGVKEHDVHDFAGFEFGFNDYNLTLVITCRKCGDIVNIEKTGGKAYHF